MTDGDPVTDRNRRQLLKRGAVGAGLAVSGLGEPVLARSTPDDDTLADLERRPEVRSLLDELGLRRIPRAASTERLEFEGSDVDFWSVTVELGYGTLKAGTIGDSTAAAFVFDEAGGTSKRRVATTQRSPPGEYADIPAGTDAWLLGGDDGVTFVRTATETERDAVMKAVPARDTETTLVYTRSDLDGFHVDVLDADDLTEQPKAASGAGATAAGATASAPDDGFLRYEVPTVDDAPAFDPTVTEVEAQFISSISKPAREVAKEAALKVGFESLGAATDSCGPQMLDCALGILLDIPSCMRCAPACTAGMGISGGAICFLCVFGICSWMLTGLDCARAVDCVTD